MTTLSLELPPELYERLAQEAKEVGDSVQVIAQQPWRNGLAFCIHRLNGNKYGKSSSWRDYQPS